MVLNLLLTFLVHSLPNLFVNIMECSLKFVDAHKFTGPVTTNLDVRSRSQNVIGPHLR